MHDRLNLALAVLWATALALAALTTIIVFYPPSAPGAVTSPISASSSLLAALSTTSTASSTNGTTTLGALTGGNIASGTAESSTSTVIATEPGQYASEYSVPYPVNWQEGGEAFSVTGAAIQGNQITLTLAIQMGDRSECVPLNIRLVADEAGTLRVPDAPAGGTFSFPDSQSCNGTAGATYSATVAFSTDGVPSPFLLTSGGNANVFFFAATSTDGGVNISLPATQG